jgi:hypothetical protein
MTNDHSLRIEDTPQLGCGELQSSTSQILKMLPTFSDDQEKIKD